MSFIQNLRAKFSPQKTASSGGFIGPVLPRATTAARNPVVDRATGLDSLFSPTPYVTSAEKTSNIYQQLGAGAPASQPQPQPQTYGPTPFGGGDVLGANTQSFGAGFGQAQGGGYQSSPYQEQEVGRLSALQDESQARIAQLRQGVEQGYSGNLGFIDEIRSNEEARRAQMLGMASNSAGIMRQGLETGLGNVRQGLEAAREGVGNRVQAGARELQQQLAQQMRAAQQQFSAAGAGDSSATEVMAPYAFSKLGTQGRAQLMAQGNEQLNQIDMQEVAVQNEFEQRLNEVQSWEVEQTSSIENYFRDQLNRITEMKQGANAARSEALTRMEEGLLQQAQQEISSARERAQNFAMSIQQWATQNIAALESAKIELSQNYGFNPQNVTAGALQGGMNVARQAMGDTFLNPLGRRRPEDEN